MVSIFYTDSLFSESISFSTINLINKKGEHPSLDIPPINNTQYK